MGNGDLADAIMAGKLDMATARKVISQMVGAIGHLHSHAIVHGDVKCDNVLLDDNFHAKLTDFEHALHLSEQPTTHYYTVCIVSSARLPSH